MRTVSDIKKVGNGARYKVFLDDEFFAVIEDEILVRSKLRTGQSYDEDFLNNLLIENGNFACFNRSLSVLEKTMKSEKMLRDYLKEKKYPRECIDRAIDKLKEYGYIDDEAFCENYISCYKNSKSRKKLKYDLLSKGIKEDIVGCKLDQLLDVVDEENKCLREGEKYLRGKTIDIKTKQKFYNHLAGKGYDFGTISKTWEELNKN